MKAALVITGSGPIVILTSHRDLTDPPLLEKLKAKGIDKFIAYEIPVPMAAARYGGHFEGHRQLDWLWSRQGTRSPVTRRPMPERPRR